MEFSPVTIAEAEAGARAAADPAFRERYNFTLLDAGRPRDDIKSLQNIEMNSVVEKIAGAMQSRNFGSAIKMLEWARDARVTHSNGSLAYADAVSAMLAPFSFGEPTPREAEELLNSYAAWAKNEPECPYAAGSYLLAIGHTGFAHRGTGWAHEVGLIRNINLLRFMIKATRHAKPLERKFQDQWYWRYCIHKYSIMGGADKQRIDNRFYNCLKDDPKNKDYYDIHSHHMLQRWGGGPDDMNLIAVAYMENTFQEKGYKGYAEIFDYPFSLDGPEFYNFDGELMLKSVRQQLDENDCQFLWSRLASCLFFNFLLDEFLDVMRTKVHRLYLEGWISRLEPWTACAIAEQRIANRETAVHAS